jgi:hypothetical protein
MEHVDATWNAENDAIRGEVIPPEEDTEDSTDTHRAGYPQTYLHKVASARPGSDPENTAAEDTAPQHTVPEHTVPEHTVPEHTAAEDTVAEDTGPEHHAAETGDEAYVAESRDEAAAVRDDTPPTVPETPGETGYLHTADVREPTDAADAEEARDAGAAEHAASDTTALDATPYTTAPDTIAPTSIADVPAATTTPDVVPPVATAPAEAETPSMAGPQGRRPGDEPIPPGLSDNLLPDSSGIREQWLRIQSQFVDDPREAVSEAATLITDVASRLETAVRERQETLRARWDGNSRADTEALRVTVQQYRHLLERLAGF